MQKIVALVIASGYLLLVSNPAAAQVAAPPNPPNGTAVTAPQQQPFLIDVFGGWLAHSDGPDDDPATEENEGSWGFNGWKVGATLGNRWLGVASSIGQTYGKGFRVTHLLAGPRVTFRFVGDGVPGAVFAHAMAGAAAARDPSGSETGSQVVLGGGFDALLFLRMEFNYVRFNLKGPAVAALGKNAFGIFMGAVVPFCFRHCSNNEYAIDLSRGK